MNPEMTGGASWPPGRAEFAKFGPPLVALANVCRVWL
jgi:hypothetical protein